MAAKPPPKAVPVRAAVVFGQNLRAAREDKGLTQGQLAETAGVQRGYLNQIEGGQRNPTLDVAEALARAVGKSLSDLLPRNPSPRKKKTPPA